MGKAAKPISFRPSATVRERLELAQEAGIQITDVINGLLEDHLDRYLRMSVDLHDDAMKRLKTAIHKGPKLSNQ